MKKLRCLLLGMIIVLSSFAQTPQYDNQVFSPGIKTVELYNTKKEQSFPLIELGSKEQLLLAFDDLNGGSRNFYYTIEHCDENWNSSNLPQSDYLPGFNEDQIRDYSYSSSTIQKYTHYQLRFPNETISPKIPGNYILKVYEDGDQNKMTLTERFYVLSPKVSLMGEIIPSNDLSLKQTNQKINFELNYGNLRVQNPNYDLKAMVMQNRRAETMQVSTQPSGIQGTRMIYNDVSTFDFPGLNEFRHFDTRSLKMNSDRIAHIYRDTANTVVLLLDPTNDRPNYAFYYDNNGKFFPGNTDGSDVKIDGDYAHIYFTLASAKSASEGSVYIVGQFNNYRLNDASKLNYDPADRHYHIQLFLKQGVYDYEYVWLPNGSTKPDNAAICGSHYETENEYQVFVYYHPASARWTELVGYRPLNTARR
ncbi:MAG TPA: DUF5103 domain-containing protein [Mucilaginibacter sp.]|jgi:hypothetical protein|nr:DUF5103 domain-containing protein [Mucilaginibacter sp.]